MSLLIETQPAYSQKKDQGTSFVLPEIMVETSKKQKSVHTLDPESVMPKSILTADEIKELGAKTAADAIILSPGVTPTGPGDSGDRFESIQIRGFNPDYTLVLIDGQRTTSQSAEGKFDLSTINADEIEKIEIIRGPQALLYGSDAIGGVVNIILKIPKDHFGMGVSAGYGQLNTFRSRAFIEGPLSKKFRVRLGGRYDFSDGFTDIFDLDRDLRQKSLKSDRKPQRTGEMRADFHWDIKNKTKARFSFRYLNRNLSVRREFNKFVEEGTESGHDNKQDIEGTAILEKTNLWGGRGEFSLRGYSSQLNKIREKNFVSRDSGRFIFREQSTQNDDIVDTLLSTRLLYERPLGKKNKLTTWWETRWQKRNSNNNGRVRRFDEQDILISDSASDKPEKIYNKNEFFFAGGFQDEITFKHLSASAGLRVEKTIN
ncbi:MAG: TonB-dependent receptor plug domain-containing protein [Deltaproteobacteria bacterium]|nr:TonB-dependent receptor plug domain-containing protein [Deltaproteobacteria bacterium]